MTILVSACLLGIACRYDGKSKPNAAVLALAGAHTLIPFCPEQLGGLPTPRIPSEYDGACVRNRAGTDVTEAFRRGADEALRIAELVRPDLVILKDKSPSCALGIRYDGSFTGRLTAGDGMTAALFKSRGIRVISSDSEMLTDGDIDRLSVISANTSYQANGNE